MLLALFIIGFAGPTQATVFSPELERQLDLLGPENDVSVIVRMVDPADPKSILGNSKKEKQIQLVKALRERAASSEKPVRSFLDTLSVKRIKSLWIINGLALTTRPWVIRRLSELPQVQSITFDAVITKPAPSVSSAGTPEWNLTAINAPALWSLGFTGQGVVVANMDTGVDGDHPDLAGRWRGGTNSWYDPNGEHAVPFDADGHGTQTMGIMVAGDAGGTSIGVAPGAQWIAVKIFNDDRTATNSIIHDGFQWLLDPDGILDTPDAPDVVNNSWGFPQLSGSCFAEFETDIEILKAAGIAVVFSGGDSGPGTGSSLSPANNPEGFAVAAVDQGGNIKFDSSRGPSACDGSVYPEVVAPGVNIKTADLYFEGIPNPYTFVDGSSYAAPHVAGVMALLLSSYPGVTVSQLESALKNLARDLGTPGPDNTYGYGLVDALESYFRLSSYKIYLPLLIRG